MALISVLAICLASAPGAIATTGSISGTVTEKEAPHKPIKGIEVCAYAIGAEGFSEEESSCPETNANGEYTISGLAPGAYEVEFSVPFEGELNYITRYYNEKTSYKEADPVTVSPASTTQNIDAELQAGGQITGKVTNSHSTPIKNITVCAHPASKNEAEEFKCSTSAANGEYTIRGLPTGDYYVQFIPENLFNFGSEEGELNYVPQYYKDAASEATAAKVKVTVPNTIPGIDAQLEEGGLITGRVTDSSSATPIKDAFVCAEGQAPLELGPCTTSNSNGEYKILGLASGSYVVSFIAHEYIDQFYNGAPARSAASKVTVTAPQTTAAINAALTHISTPPANTTAPAISGAPAVGSSLLCTPGLWGGIPVPTFTYQWLRNGSLIAGANATSYTVQTADTGTSISCRVTAKNINSERSATSASIAIPVPPPPPPAPKPVIAIAGSAIVIAHNATKLHLACSAAQCKGTVELTVQAVVKIRKGKKTFSRKQTLILAKGSYSIAAGKSATVVLHLNATGKRRLRHLSRHHKLTVKLTVSADGGNTTTKSVHAT